MTPIDPALITGELEWGSKWMGAARSGKAPIVDPVPEPEKPMERVPDVPRAVLRRIGMEGA